MKISLMKKRKSLKEKEFWICECSYFENDIETVTGNVTTNTGGGS